MRSSKRSTPTARSPSFHAQQDNISFPTLAVGESVTISIEVIAQLPGTFTDTASVSADQADPNTQNNTATVTETVIAQAADLQVSISPATP